MTGAALVDTRPRRRCPHTLGQVATALSAYSEVAVAPYY
jgi:hypothetical protein